MPDEEWLPGSELVLSTVCSLGRRGELGSLQSFIRTVIPCARISFTIHIPRSYILIEFH